VRENHSAVLRNISYRCVRQLLPGSRVLVEEGARVEGGTPIASGVGRVHRVLLPAELHGFTGFRKRPGDSVKAGETLAVLTYQMGFGLAEYVCPVDGVIEAILDRAMVIRDHAASWLAGLPGVVSRVIPDREIEITATGHLIPGWAGSGPAVGGPACLVGELYTPAGIDRALGPQVQGAVVVSLTYTAGRALELAARYGAAALVCASLSYAELAAFAARSGRALPFSLVVLEAFGSSALDPGVREVLEAVRGQELYVDGGRPGEERPVVFVPGERGDDLPSSGLYPGCRVRVLAGAYSGRHGEVWSLPEAVQTTETGYRVLTVDVRLSDGSTVQVAGCNLEITGYSLPAGRASCSTKTS